MKAIRKYDLKSLITFHSRVVGAEYFAKNLEAAGELINKQKLPKEPIWADYVEGKMSTSVRAEKLKKLRQSSTKQIGILSNARCLGEGVDVPALDGVAFIDPKNSESALNLAMAYYFLKDYENVRKYAKLAVALGVILPDFLALTLNS